MVYSLGSAFSYQWRNVVARLALIVILTLTALARHPHYNH